MSDYLMEKLKNAGRIMQARQNHLDHLRHEVAIADVAYQEASAEFNRIVGQIVEEAKK